MTDDLTRLADTLDRRSLLHHISSDAREAEWGRTLAEAAAALRELAGVKAERDRLKEVCTRLHPGNIDIATLVQERDAYKAELGGARRVLEIIADGNSDDPPKYARWWLDGSELERSAIEEASE